MKRNKTGLLICILLLLNLMICAPAQSLVTFNWIRLLIPHPNPGSTWDPRVSVDAESVQDPENDGFADNANYENYFHWAKNEGDFAILSIYYHYELPSELDILAFHNAVQASVQTWQDIPTANLIVEFEGMMTTDPWEVDGKNTVSFCLDGSVAGFTESEVIGKTLLTWDSEDTEVPPNEPPNGITTELIDCDIILNASVFDEGGRYYWSTTEMDYSNKTIDVQSVVTHEFGHALGIAHPFSVVSRPDSSEIPIATCPTMFGLLQPAFVDNLNMRTLDQYDINCASFLYPDLSDGNDYWTAATPIYPGEDQAFSIIPDDRDWYVIYLDQYYTIKVVLQEPSTTNTMDLELYYYDSSEGEPVQSFSVYEGSELKVTSNYNGYTYQTVYAHTVMQGGSYYLKVKGKTDTSASDYTLDVYTSDDGDGDERSLNRTLPIPTGDSLPDSWEIANGLDPTDINDAMEDSDNDGLLNIDEMAYGTQPFNDDTDGDGIADGWEVNYSLNPLSSADASEDPDQDGATNLMEFEVGTNPYDPLSVFYVKEITPVNTSPYEKAIKIIWAHEPYMFYEIFYSASPSGPFTRMEEFNEGNEMDIGTEGPEYIDQGYPFIGEALEGAIRSAPLQDNDTRYYIIRRK